MIGADKLVYQDVDDMKQAMRDMNPKLREFESSCFDGNYITGNITAEYLDRIERSRLTPDSMSDRDASGGGADREAGRSQLHLQLSGD